MLPQSKAILGAVWAAAMIALVAPAEAASERPLYVLVGASARAPIGWIEFCNENPKECATGATQARDIVLTPKVWNDLVQVNKWVNDTVKPVTDMDHWGVVERWSYPDDGKGDCEDYVLLKRRMLIQAGWPREALLITVVRDKKGEGHAGFPSAIRGRPFRPPPRFRADNQELRESGHVPTLPVPRPGSRAAGVPQRRPHHFQNSATPRCHGDPSIAAKRALYSHGWGSRAAQGDPTCSNASTP